ncbi:glycosyltransferase family 4 protein [Crocosphaera sp. XPORK-15E]|uniref:glycosyltransferase family 4 protein n=1 Tax=Crocosphaera sp. XPORK-15E TaxID=3110247 RepID=UPI002B1FC927|nr:glycosyltransferase family 4 protein [Crocosphaera sp. XPORK-15E]MEA5533082.1 glycosyltransferase family 4 protein [Crocosphaera sp. XPORK-15E]
MKIIITTVQVPFVRGGAEILAEELLGVLQEAGHEVEIVAVPLKGYPPQNILDTMLACRLLDIIESHGQSIDKVIGLKFPAYLIPHPRKVLWLLHQHRDAYDLWGHEYCNLCRYPDGFAIRDSIINSDHKTFAECSGIFTIAANVSKRLKYFSNFDSIPLYHPPKNSELFHCQPEKGYLFFPSRLNPIKRQELVLQSLAKTTNPVKVVFAGKSGDNFYHKKLISLAAELGVADRVTFLGSITEEEKIQHYANALGIIYPPLDEDYGYVTLEGMLSSKPIITCTDSGGPLEFVHHEDTGLIKESPKR